MFSSLTLDQDIVVGKGDNDRSRLNNVYIEDVIDGVTDIKWIVWVETTENHNGQMMLKWDQEGLYR